MAVRFRSILHRVLSVSQMDEGRLNLKDDSRPAFPRPKYTVGLYLDAVDARPDKNTVIGSHHAFMMAVMDKMLDYLRGLDLVTVKGAMESRRAGDGVILEGFRHGCVLAVTFDTLDSLEDLWTLHTKGRLTPIMQDALVDRALLGATNTVKLTLRAKMWEDEYTGCKGELLSRPDTRARLVSFEKDLAMVQRVKEHQHVMPEVTGQARDVESKFEHDLGDFMLTVKRALPQTTTTIRNVKEFQTNIKMARGFQNLKFESVDNLFKAIEFFHKVFTDIQREIVYPLLQVRALCENEKQRTLKKTIKSACAEVLTILKPEADLQKVRHRDWGPKVLQREHNLFYGLISLVPISLDRLTTIDVSTDEYVREYAEMAGK